MQVCILKSHTEVYNPELKYLFSIYSKKLGRIFFKAVNSFNTVSKLCPFDFTWFMPQYPAILILFWGYKTHEID